VKRHTQRFLTLDSFSVRLEVGVTLVDDRLSQVLAAQENDGEKLSKADNSLRSLITSRGHVNGLFGGNRPAEKQWPDCSEEKATGPQLESLSSPAET
jgi:hypothetical protein